MATKKNDYVVTGDNARADFNLKVYRGDGMALLAMNWKKGQPPVDFVGFAIEYKEPGGKKFFTLKNRIGFSVSKPSPSTLAPFQKFRWVHFPRNAEMKGAFEYRVTPVFMNTKEELSYGEAQTASLALSRDTYAGKMNVTFTRGFVSSQAFVDKYGGESGVKKLLPPKADEGLDFKPTHELADEALAWMGFEARTEIYAVLDAAAKDKKAKVDVVAYDLSERYVVEKLEKLGARLRIIIDDSGTHAKPHSAETVAAKRLAAKGAVVKRQHMGTLQHNKTIVVRGGKSPVAISGSTNFTWRGVYVQANNAVAVYGAKAVLPFAEAFEAYWNNEPVNGVAGFGSNVSAGWNKVDLGGVDARVTFSPHGEDNRVLKDIAKDIAANTSSSLFFSLAFLYQTPGAMQAAIKQLRGQADKFVYGISDKEVGGMDVQTPNGKNPAVVYPEELSQDLPEPFKREAVGGGGTRMHHKFVVIDFDKPTARVYTGSYNFSVAADERNGENLMLIRDRKVAISYMIEALRLFDHYHFRVATKKAKTTKKALTLQKPPVKKEKAWWAEYYTDARKVKDREMFG